MVRISTMLIFLLLVMLLGSGTCETLRFDSEADDFEWIREGITLELYCRHDPFNDVDIRSPAATVVRGSQLLPGMTNRYAFHKNSTFSVLVIKHINRRDKGVYTCQEGLEKRSFAVIRIFYSPKDSSPQCTSNYNSHVIFDDIRQNYINFTCTTEEGNPPVTMALTVHESKNNQNITDLANVCTVCQNFHYIRTLSCHMNESLANITFLCDVTQQFPSLYTGSYRGSCSFGPLRFLSNFSVKVYKPIATVAEGEDVNLTCITNVTGVGIMWALVPVDLEKHVATSDNFSQMWIKNVKQQSVPEITVQCIGSYGNRNVTDSVKITIEGKPIGHQGRPILIVTPFLVILVIIAITFLFGCYARKRGVSCSLRNKPDVDHNTPQNTEVNTFHMETTSSTPNKNNANNIAIQVCDGDKEGDSDPSNDQLDDTMVSDMHDNPVYESASISADVTLSESTVDQYAVVSKQDNKVDV